MRVATRFKVSMTATLRLTCALILFTGLIVAQDDTGSETVDIKLAWNPPEAAEVFRSTDSEGVPIPLTYLIRHSTDVAAPDWEVILATTNHMGGVTISNLLTSEPHFFTITVSNFFLESLSSEILGIPATTGLKSRVTKTAIILP